MLQPGPTTAPAPAGPTAVVDEDDHEVRAERTARGTPPSLVLQGCTTGDLPAPWSTEGETTASATLVGDPDRRELTSTAAGALPYQRFDLPHPGGGATVSWAGTTDTDRVVALHAWNCVSGSWDAVARGRGRGEEVLDLTARLSWEHDDAGTVHLLALGVDPFDVPAPGPVMHRFRDPASYDFAIVHLTDTQYLSQGAVAAPDEEQRRRFGNAYLAMTEWVAANAETRKIAYVAHTGDLIESWLWPDADPQVAAAEFAFASAAQAVLDDAGVPNGVLPGNHDNKSGSGEVELFNTFFGPARYAHAARRWPGAAYAGPWREGDNANHADLFSAGGLDLVAVHLGYGVTEEAAAWADRVLTEHADRPAIVLTHAYLEASWQSDGLATEYSEEGGAPLVRELVERHPNVVLVLSGHNHGVAWALNRGGSRADAGHGGRPPAVELLADYQSYERDGERSCGFLRLLQVDVARGEITVSTYSPSLDAFGAVPFDPAPRSYDDAVDEMVLPLAVPTRTTTFSTRCVRVA